MVGYSVMEKTSIVIMLYTSITNNKIKERKKLDKAIPEKVQKKQTGTGVIITLSLR
jgi:hypothetical protein